MRTIQKMFVGVCLVTSLLALGFFVVPLTSYGMKKPPQQSNQLKKTIKSYQTKLTRSGAQCEWKSTGNVPKEAVQKTLVQCKKAIDKKYKECSKAEGWHLDIQIDVKDKNGGEEFEELVCRGGCPGKGAGDSFPLSIKSEFIDTQGKEYEIVCSASCSRWDCGKALSSNISLSLLNYQDYQETACTEQEPCTPDLAQSSEIPQSFELIFTAPAGIDASAYPLKIWLRRLPENKDGGISWGSEIPLKNIQSSCGDTSQDGKTCKKTSGPVVLSGAHPGFYSVTLSDNSKKVLYEREKIILIQ